MTELNLEWKHKYFILGLGFPSEVALSVILSCAYLRPIDACVGLVKFGNRQYLNKHGELAVVRGSRYKTMITFILKLQQHTKFYSQICTKKKRGWFQLTIYPCNDQPKLVFELINFGNVKPACCLGSGPHWNGNLFSFCQSLKEQFSLVV